MAEMVIKRMRTFPFSLKTWSLWRKLKKNKGALIGLGFIMTFVVTAIFAPWIANYDPSMLNPQHLRLPPFWAEGGSSQFILGTDDVGRDLFSRLIYGTRISLFIGLSVVFISLSIGTFLGLLAGYFGGWVDRIIMRFIDMLMALPSILLAIVVVAILGPGLTNAVIAVSIVAIPSFCRIVRSSVIAEKEKEYVQASLSFGASSGRIILREILPNCMAPLIVQSTLGISDGILNAAALGFLGLGAQPPTAEWGVMLADSRAYIESSPWMVTLPGLCILLAVLAFNLFGDGLRDALDPKLKR